MSRDTLSQDTVANERRLPVRSDVHYGDHEVGVSS